MSSIGSDGGRPRGYSEHKESELTERPRSESIESIESGYHTPDEEPISDEVSDISSVSTEDVINAGSLETEELEDSKPPSSFVDKVLQRVKNREIDVSARIDEMMGPFKVDEELLAQEIAKKTPLPRKEAFSQEDREKINLVLMAKEQIERDFQGLSADSKGRFQKKLPDGRTLTFVRESEEDYKIVVSSGQEKRAFRLYYHQDVSFWNDHAAICLQKLESCYKAMPEKGQIAFGEEYQKTKDSIKQPSINSFSSPFISKEKKIQKERQRLLEEFIRKTSIDPIEEEVLINVWQEDQDFAHVSIHKPLENSLHILIEKGQEESSICYKKEAIPYTNQETPAAKKLSSLIENETKTLLQEAEIDPTSLSEDDPYPLAIDLIHRGSEEEFKKLRSAYLTFQNKPFKTPFQKLGESDSYIWVRPRITLYRSAPEGALSDKLLADRAKSSLTNAHCLMQLQERIRKNVPSHPILEALDEKNEENAKRFSTLQEVIVSSTFDKQKALFALYQAKTHKHLSQEDIQAYVDAAERLLLEWEKFKDAWIQDNSESPYRIDERLEEQIFSKVDGMENLSKEAYQKIKNSLVHYIILQTLKTQDLDLLYAIFLPIDENAPKEEKDSQREILERFRNEIDKSLESFLNNQVESRLPAEKIVFSLPFEAEIAQEIQEGRILEKTKDLLKKTPLEVQKGERLADFCLRGLEKALDKSARSLEEVAKPLVESRLAIYQNKKEELYLALEGMNQKTSAYKTLFAYLNLLEAIAQKRDSQEIAKAFAQVYQELGSVPFVMSEDPHFLSLQPTEDSTGYFASITRIFS